MPIRYQSRSRYNSFWPPYVPVAERKAKAQRQIAKLKKKNEAIQPIKIEGRAIALSFWGKGWCTHLESFGDYANRLPRGRSYVRNGSVCHLAITQGCAEALVAGSSLYQVKVNITPLTAKKWKNVKARCTGRIGSLIELLQGKFSDEIMQSVTDRQNGLFPLPGEIEYHCNCPDWADMCKHIAAVMYGIGARLDAQPELLFRMRGIDPGELLDAESAAQTISGMGQRKPSARRRLSADKVAAVFDVDLDPESPAGDLNSPPPPTTNAKGGYVDRKEISAPGRRRNRERKANGVKPARTSKPATTRRSAPEASASSKPFTPSAKSIVALRQRLGMSRSAFARALGVSPVTVTNWENASGKVFPHARCVAGLRRLATTAAPKSKRTGSKNQ